MQHIEYKLGPHKIDLKNGLWCFVLGVRLEMWKKQHQIEIIFSVDLFQSMESLHTLNLGNNLIEVFSMPLITEWFTAESSADDVQEPEETQKSSNFRLILNENPVSTEIYPTDGKLH